MNAPTIPSLFPVNGLSEGFPDQTYISASDPAVRAELQAFYAQLEGWLSIDHKGDGTHGDIRCASVRSENGILSGTAPTVGLMPTTFHKGSVVCLVNTNDSNGATLTAGGAGFFGVSSNNAQMIPLRGVEGSVYTNNTSATTTAGSIAGYFLADHAGVGNSSLVQGVTALTFNTGTGTVTQAIGLSAAVNGNATGTITTAYGVYVQIGTTGITTAYSFYCADASATFYNVGPVTVGTLTTTGTLIVSGFGTSTFSAGGIGFETVIIRNTTAGTGNGALLSVGNDVSANAGTLYAFSSTYTSGTIDQANGVSLTANLSGGLSLAAADAAGVIRFYAGGTTLNATLQIDGSWTWASYGAGTITSDASGNLTSVSDERMKNRIRPLTYGIKEVLQLNPIIYGYNKRSRLERKHLYGGFSAQNVKRSMPLAIGQSADGMMTLSERPILAAVVNAIKSLHRDVAALKEAA